jgi:hypothetical protein
MTTLNEKIKKVLDETRILVLIANIFVGFQFRSIWEKGFEKLPKSSQLLLLLGLVIMLIVVGFLLTPAAYHRIVEKGNDSRDLHALATRLMMIVLFLFGVSLSLNLYLVTKELLGTVLGYVLLSITFLTCMFWWYGLEYFKLKRKGS